MFYSVWKWDTANRRYRTLPYSYVFSFTYLARYSACRLYTLVCTSGTVAIRLNRAAANGRGGSHSRLCRRIAASVAGGLLSRLHRSEVRQWGLFACTLRERSPFPRAGHKYIGPIRWGGFRATGNPPWLRPCLASTLPPHSRFESTLGRLKHSAAKFALRSQAGSASRNCSPHTILAKRILVPSLKAL